MENYFLADTSAHGVSQGYAKNLCSISTLGANKSRGAIVMDNIFVASFTLVCVRSGNIRITTESKQVIQCNAPGMIVLEKEQIVSVHLDEVDGHLSFEVLEIPHHILMSAYDLLMENLENIPSEIIGHPRIVYTKDFPARREVFDSLREKVLLQEEGTLPGKIADANEKDDLVPHSLLFILSLFLRHPAAAGMLSRSLKMSIKDKVYNIIYKDPERQWKLADVASIVFMSASTLKRKLATEGTTFSELYLIARMNLATKLLRTGKYSVSSVAVLCGYDSVSYFICCFKKQFNITPSAFIRSINH